MRRGSFLYFICEQFTCMYLMLMLDTETLFGIFRLCFLFFSFGMKDVEMSSSLGKLS